MASPLINYKTAVPLLHDHLLFSNPPPIPGKRNFYFHLMTKLKIRIS